MTFQADISLEKGGNKISAKSIMGIMTFAASQGTEICVHADGPDEKEAVSAIVELFESKFGEE